MARPKSQQPLKQKLTLSIAPAVREQLDIVANAKGMSISALVEMWTTQAIDNLNDIQEEMK